jgi:hypothetical protein
MARWNIGRGMTASVPGHVEERRGFRTFGCPEPFVEGLMTPPDLRESGLFTSFVVCELAAP